MKGKKVKKFTISLVCFILSCTTQGGKLSQESPLPTLSQAPKEAPTLVVAEPTKSLLEVNLCKANGEAVSCDKIIHKVMNEDSWARFTLHSDQIDHCKARFRVVRTTQNDGSVVVNAIRNIHCFDKHLQSLFSTVAVTPENKCAVLRFERNIKDFNESSQFVIVLCEDGFEVKAE